MADKANRKVGEMDRRASSLGAWLKEWMPSIGGMCAAVLLIVAMVRWSIDAKVNPVREELVGKIETLRTEMSSARADIQRLDKKMDDQVTRASGETSKDRLRHLLTADSRGDPG